MFDRTVFALFIFGACAEPTTTLAPNEAGVVAYRISEAPDELAIVGEDADGNVVGRVDVKKGPYTMSEWFANGRVGDQLNVDGLRIGIEVDGVPGWSHEADGYHSLKLPIPDGERYHRFDAFALDRQVTQALARWDITLTSQHASAAAPEVGYDLMWDRCLDTNSVHWTADPIPYNICGIANNPENQEYTATIGTVTLWNETWTDEMCVCNRAGGCNGVAQYDMYYAEKACCGSAFCQTIYCGGAGPNGCAQCGLPADTGYTWANRPWYVGLGIGAAGSTCYVNGGSTGFNCANQNRWKDSTCHWY